MTNEPTPDLEPVPATVVTPPPDDLTEMVPTPVAPLPVAAPAATQLQQMSASLLHVQTNMVLEIPSNLAVIHVGKPNSVIPPDIDVSGFPDSDIVSRTHADIRCEPDAFYLEDMGSSNGTYVNNLPLPPGNRHRLRAGDRIALGKGDKVTFIFQFG
jgi:pSer/pThr/pTyr-binding forkhead associated (FHA) protein